MQLVDSGKAEGLFHGVVGHATIQVDLLGHIGDIQGNEKQHLQQASKKVIYQTSTINN